MIEVYLGTDPGQKGAFCALVPSTGEIYFMDTKKHYLEILGWLETIKANKDYTLRAAVIEDVHSLYGMSAKSNLSFGRSIEKLHAICAIADIKLILVQPKEWQKGVGVTAKGKEIKNNVAELCKTLYPGCNIYGPKGGLMDGRSDSLMMARYCAMIHEPGFERKIIPKKPKKKKKSKPKG